MKRLLIYNIVLYLSFFAVLETFGQKLSKTDLAAMYSEYYFTSLDAEVYHSSDEKSTVYLNINLHHLTYLPTSPTEMEANFSIGYSIFSSYNSKFPLDTATLIFNESEHAGKQMEMAVNFDVPAAFPGDYILKVKLTDLNQADRSVFKYIHIYKTSRFSSQNFFLTDGSEHPIFGNFSIQDNFFKIRYNNADTGQLIIRYYNRSFPIAKPPFAMDKNTTYTFEPDSFYTITLENGITPLLELPYHGIYYLEANLGIQQGLTLYRFDDGFPEVNAPALALAPLRYLTTESEFDKLLSYQDYKTAVDSFWLERASYEPERAKNMIRKFYQRVVDVNHLFTSFHEGWKTDRGLLYIIYGPPSEVYRKDGEEEWIYGERGNPMSIRFYFNQVENPFTENDYSLQRSPVFKTSWYIAIENWRR